MTAPGNSALVLTLLAVFLACSGYAAGRLHQRFQAERHREQAYRDGYDTATRSIFSLAARLVAPRRGSRATPRPVLDGSLVPEPTTLPPAALSAAAALATPALTNPALTNPALADPAAPNTPFAVSVEAGPPFAGSFVAGPALVDPARPDRGSASESMDFASSPPAPSPRRAAAAPERSGASLGFPVPPRPPARILGEPAAFGGVVYRPFPDPRLVGSAEPLPADRGTISPVPAYPQPAPHQSAPESGSHLSAYPRGAGATPQPADADVAEPQPALQPEPTSEPEPEHKFAPEPTPEPTHEFTPEFRPEPTHEFTPEPKPELKPEPPREPEPASSGRHTVPEELVQAETYRLPPDRVFRAKVPDQGDRPALPEESTTRLWVPKPRQS